jgi:hypothetical protein
MLSSTNISGLEIRVIRYSLPNCLIFMLEVLLNFQIRYSFSFSCTDKAMISKGDLMESEAVEERKKLSNDIIH